MEELTVIQMPHHRETVFEGPVGPLTVWIEARYVGDDLEVITSRVWDASIHGDDPDIEPVVIWQPEEV